jgi:outer membrane lipoprotein SlyB
MAIESSPGAVTPSKPPILWLGAGGLVLVSLAAAAAVALRPSVPEPQMVPLSNAKNTAMIAPSTAPSTSPATEKVAQTAPAATPQTASVESPHAAKPAAKPVPKAVPKTVKPVVAPEPVRVAAICSYCGVVESVQAVQRKGQGTGIGAVAGGVLGAAVANQVGHGNGRAAMTVLGAVGGGLAGNEVEKRARSETVFEVRIRFDDGSVRTLEETSAPKVGARVEVQGDKITTVG